MLRERGLTHRHAEGAERRDQRTDKGVPKMLDLSCCPFRRTGVIYNHIGAATLRVQTIPGPPRRAAKSSSFHPAPRPAPGAPRPGHRQTPASHIVYPSRPPKSMGRPARRLCTPPASIAAACCLQQSADFRMGQLFQVFPLGGSGGRRGKDDASQPRCGPRVHRARRPPPPTAAARPPRRAAAAAPRGPRGRRPIRRRPVAPDCCATVLLPLATPPSKPMMRNTLLRFPLRILAA